MAAITSRLGQVDDGLRHASRLADMSVALEGQVARVSERIHFVELMEGRLNGLHEVASEVDRKLATQLERRAELDALKTQCDGVIAQMMDSQQKVDAVLASQTKLAPLDIRMSILEDRVEKTGARVKDVQRDEEILAQQEARLIELSDTSRTLADEADDRMKQMQTLRQELERSGAVKDELLGDLARIQARQREAVAQAEAVEEQLRRADAMYRQLEQRRSQLAFSEKKLSDVELKMAELAQKSAYIDDRLKALADREAVIGSVRSELDAVHQISAKSREDLQFVTEHRDQVTGLRRQVQELLTLASATEDKIASIEARRRDVEEVQSKTALISNLLEDVRVNLETVGEQKAMVDQLTEKLANVQFVMQEAQNTLRMLSQERELAERIEQSIRQLRSRSGGASGEGRQTA